MPVQTKIQVRRDTADNWVTAQTAAGATPLLAAGEHGYETDTGKFKIGDGTTLWGALGYAKSGATTAYSELTGVPSSFTPSGHAISHESGGSDELELAPAQITGTAVITSDSRLSDARTPTAHAASHASAGADPITLAQSQVTSLTGDLALKAPIESPIFTGTVTGMPSVPTVANSADNFGFMGIPQVSTSSSINPLTLSHAGKHIYTTVTAQTHTIPASTTTNFEIGTTIVFINPASVTTSIGITSDTLILAGVGTSTGLRTLAPWGMATAVKITSTSWIISGNGLT